MCASIMPLGHCVVAKARCNWYLRDINIYSLSKKMATAWAVWWSGVRATHKAISDARSIEPWGGVLQVVQIKEVGQRP
jgi:hypothetical protein